MTKAKASASEFLLDLVPSQIRSAYETLSGLSFPLNDQQSIAEAVDGDLGLLGALQATDFPLVSVMNAFEKLRDRLPLHYPFGPSLPPETPEDRVERPSVAAVYEATFGPACGQKALEAYVAARRSMPELQAVVVGHMEGRRCLDALADVLRNFPPTPRVSWGP